MIKEFSEFLMNQQIDALCCHWQQFRYNSSDVNRYEHIRGSTVNVSLSFHNVHNGNQ